MKMILIDAKYYGVALRTGRKNARISVRELSNILSVSAKEINRFESGKSVPPIDVLFRIMTSGIVMLSVKKNK